MLRRLSLEGSTCRLHVGQSKFQLFFFLIPQQSRGIGTIVVKNLVGTLFRWKACAARNDYQRTVDDARVPNRLSGYDTLEEGTVEKKDGVSR